MTVKDLVESVNACLTSQGGCSACVFCECDNPCNCKNLLAQAVEEKFGELVELLDDKVNHHYYDTLEFYQEENIALREKFDKIVTLLEANTTQ